jgi:O-antigen/teichoic acid export membrane protein
MEEKNKKSFISHFLAIGSGTIINMALGLLSTPIITRIVDPDEYGQLSIFNMYSGIALMILCLGLDQSLVRFFYENETVEYKQSLVRYCFCIPFIITIIIALLVSLLSVEKIIVFEFTPIIMVLMSLNVVVAVVNRIAILLLRVTYQSKKYAICNVMTKAFYIATALILCRTIKNHYFALLAIATIVSFLLPTLYAIFENRELWKLSVKYQLPNKSEVMRYGLPLILSMGITTVFQAIDKMSLNHYCTYEDIGIYSSAMTLVNIFAIIQTTFNSLWGPMQVEHYVKYPEDTGYIQKANQMITFIMFFMGISLILVKDVFALLLGEKYRLAGAILPFLIFNPIMFTISETTCAGIGVSKKSYLNIVVASGACITNVIGNAILVPRLECKGAAISTGISYIVFWALRTIVSNRYYYVDYGITKILFITLLVSVYAFYNTFYTFSCISVLFYILIAVVLIFLYQSSIKEILKMGKKIVNQKVKK